MALDGILSTGGLYTQNSGFLGSLALAQSGAGAAVSLTPSYSDGAVVSGGGQAAVSSSTTTASASAQAVTGTQGTGGYSSTSIQVDSLAGLVVTQFRDPQTGTVEFQIPSKQVVETYRLRSLSTPPYNPYQLPAPSPKEGQHAGATHGDGAGGKSGGGQQNGGGTFQASGTGTVPTPSGSGSGSGTTSGDGSTPSILTGGATGTPAGTGSGAGGDGGIAYSGGPTVVAGAGTGDGTTGTTGTATDSGAPVPLSASTTSSGVNLVA